jgi:transcriptional regulator GlxA family with amidase domain
MFDFSIIVLEGAFASSVSSTLDILESASKLAPSAAAVSPRWRVLSPNGGSVRLSSGVNLATQKMATRARTDESVWIIPGLGIDQFDSLIARLEKPDARLAANAIARHIASGGRIAASCSAVFILHSAGVLKQHRITTTWWLAPKLQLLVPLCKVDVNKMVCVDGSLTTAGAAFAQIDLMIHLIKRLCGDKLADWLTRVLIVDGREAQAPYIVPEVLAGGDKFISAVVAQIESALPDSISIARLAKNFGISIRTLSRRVQEATGQTTIALVQSVKLRRARTLLENGRTPVEQIAQAVGYQDATALRRMMQKVTGENPSAFRRNL